MTFPKIITTLIIAIVIQCSAIAQISFTIATDAIAPVFGGYDVELGLNFKKHRLAATYGAKDLPDFYNDQSEEFQFNRNYISLVYSRFFNNDQKRLHAGLDLAYFLEETATLLDNDGNTLEELKRSFGRIGIRVGYIWQPFDGLGLYIEPAFRVGFIVGDEENTFSNNTVLEKHGLDVTGPLIRVGWKLL